MIAGAPQRFGFRLRDEPTDGRKCEQQLLIGPRVAARAISSGTGRVFRAIACAIATSIPFGLMVASAMTIPSEKMLLERARLFDS